MWSLRDSNWRGRLLGIAMAVACLCSLGQGGPQAGAAQPPAAHKIVTSGPLPVASTVRVTDEMMHWSNVNCVAFSPNGQFIASASNDGTVVVWSADGHRELCTFRGHRSQVTCVAFGFDGRMLVSGDGDGIVKVWLAETGQETRSFSVADEAADPRRGGGPKYLARTGVAFSADAGVVAAAHGRRTTVWSMETGRELRTIREEGDADRLGGAGQAIVDAIALSPDGKLLAIRTSGRVDVWSVRSGEKIRSHPSDDSMDPATRHGHRVAFSPDGTVLAAPATVEVDSSTIAQPGEMLPATMTVACVRTWSVQGGREILTITPQARASIGSIAFDAAGETLAVRADAPRLYSARTGELLGGMERGHGDSRSNSIALSPDGKTIAYPDLGMRWYTYSVGTWSVGAPGELSDARYQGPRGVASSPDGTMFAVAGLEGVTGSIRLLSARTGEVLRTLVTQEDTAFVSLLFSPDGERLACCSGPAIAHRRGFSKAKMHVFSVETGEESAAVAISSDLAEAMRFGLFDVLAFSPDGTMLASAMPRPSDRDLRRGEITLYDAHTMDERRTIGSHPGGITSLAFSPDGSTLASGGADGRVRLWSVQTGREKLVFDGDQLTAPVLAFSADGEMIVSGQVHDLTMWSASTGKAIRSFAAPMRGVNAILSPDGSTLACSFVDNRRERGRLTLIDTSTGLIRESWDAPGPMLLLDYRRDGRALATLNRNGTSFLVELPPAGAVRAGPQQPPLPRTAGGLPDDEQPRHEGRRVVYWLKRLAEANVPNEIYGSPDRREPNAAFDRMGSAALPAIIDALRHNPHVAVRATAVKVLPRYGRDARAAVPALLAALGDESIAFAAAEMLRQIDPAACSRGMPVLIERLARRRSDEHVPDGIAPDQAAVRMQNSVPSVMRALVGPTGGRRPLRGDARAMVKEWVPLFVEALKDSEERNRRWAAASLRQLGPDAAAAVPALIGTLGDQDDSVRTEAAKALGAVGPDASAAVPALIEALPDNRAALRALHGVEPAPTKVDVPALTEKLKHRDPGMRMYAADRLRSLGPDAAPAVSVLVEALEDESLEVRRTAITALHAMGPAAKDAVPALTVRVRHDAQGVVRSQAVAALANIEGDDEAVVAALLDALMDEDPIVAVTAAKAIGPFGPDTVRRAIPVLTKRLSERPVATDAEVDQSSPHRTPTIQQIVQAMIGKDGFQNPLDNEKEWIALLATALEHDDEKTRRWAARSLGMLGPDARAAVPSLVAALEDEDSAVHSLALRALMKVDVEAAQGVAPTLIVALRDPNLEIRQRAASSLGQLGPAAVAAVPALVEVLEDESEATSGSPLGVGDPRSAAARALGEIGPAASAAVPALLNALNDDHRFLRSSAAEALKKIGPGALKATVPALIEALKDPDVETRMDALGTLGSVGPHARSAVPTLIDLLKDEYRIVRMSAARTLGAIGPEAKAAGPALSEALSDSDPTVRKAAADALKLIQPGGGEPPERASLTPLEAAKQLIAAATSGDVTSARSLLASTPEVLNAKIGNAYGSTPLHFAAYNGRTEMVQLLLASNAEVNVVNRYGVMPLHDAAGQGHEEIVAMLLDHGSKVDVKDSRGKTPLAYAVQNGHRQVADLLGHRGAKDDRMAEAVPRTARTMFIDTHHDNFTFAGNYPGMKAVFEEAGYDVRYSDVPLVAGNITGIGALVLPIGIYRGTPFSDEEAADIARFVESGGALLIVPYAAQGESGNKILRHFGLESRTSRGHAELTDFAPHPLSAGLKTFKTVSPYDVFVIHGERAMKLGWCKSGEILFVAVEHGSGKVVGWGELNNLTGSFGEGSNQGKLLRNIAQWFLEK